MIFLSHRNLNIPSSLNNPVLGSKIVGKTQKKRSEKKATKFESWLTSDNFLLCISYRTYHFHVRLFSARTETYLSMSVFRVLWISTVFLSFDPVLSCWTHRDKTMPHTKRLADVEAIPFPTSKHFQSTAFSNSPPHKMTLSLIRKWGIHTEVFQLFPFGK